MPILMGLRGFNGFGGFLMGLMDYYFNELGDFRDTDKLDGCTRLQSPVLPWFLHLDTLTSATFAECALCFLWH